MGQAADVLGLVGTTVEQVVFDACVDSGGFGLIYRGRHTGLDEIVAIKCLRITGLQGKNASLKESIAARFRDETKLLYRLSQGSLDIVRCIGSGTLVAPATQELTPYMVLEWLEGGTLSQDLRARREADAPPRTLAQSVELLDPAVSGIAYAHAQGVVHRDVKPGNLFLSKTRDGVRCKVLDFGLAKILEVETLGVKPSVETGLGVHFCSPSYGAPEQFTPKVGPIGPWTDIYSLTLVLLEMMTGEKVRPANSLAQGLLLALDPNSGSPRASTLGLRLAPPVEDLLHRALAQNPLERPRDAGVFWAALKDVMKAEPPLGATIADADVAGAMEKVRAAQVARTVGPARAAAPAAPAKGSPFAGTMLMTTAPVGAPHLAAAAPAGASTPSVASTVAVAGMRSPVAATVMGPSPAQQAGRSFPPPAAPAPAPPAAVRAGASVPPAAMQPSAHAQPAPGPPNPPHGAPMRTTGSRAAPMQATGSRAAPAPPPHAGRVPTGSFGPPPLHLAPPKKKGGGAAAAAILVVALLLVAGGFATWWFRFRPHP